MAKVKQADKVLRYIKESGSITRAQAFNDLSVSQLATRIFELKKSGYEIHSRFVSSKNRYGEPVKYKEYFLRDDVGMAVKPSARLGGHVRRRRMCVPYAEAQ